MNMKLSYAENRFLGIQHTFWNNWFVEADYTGSHGVDLYAERNLNTYVGNTLINNGSTVGYNPYFAGITFADNSNYLGIQRTSIVSAKVFLAWDFV